MLNKILLALVILMLLPIGYIEYKDILSHEVPDQLPLELSIQPVSPVIPVIPELPKIESPKVQPKLPPVQPKPQPPRKPSPG